MITTFRLPADELDLDILKSIKKAFKGKDIEIIILDTSESSKPDELLKRIENLRNNKKCIQFTGVKFFKTYRKKIANVLN